MKKDPMDQLQRRADEEKEKVAELTEVYQQANSYRLDLQDALKEMTRYPGWHLKWVQEQSPCP